MHGQAFRPDGGRTEGFAPFWTERLDVRTRVGSSSRVGLTAFAAPLAKANAHAAHQGIDIILYQLRSSKAMPTPGKIIKYLTTMYEHLQHLHAGTGGIEIEYFGTKVVAMKRGNLVTASIQMAMDAVTRELLVRCGAPDRKKAGRLQHNLSLFTVQPLLIYSTREQHVFLFQEGSVRRPDGQAFRPDGGRTKRGTR